MTTVELLERIQRGENSGVEFQRDEVQNHDLAKEIVAFLNLAGGSVLLGVEDDGTISGTTRPKLDEWIAEICRVKIEPPMIPFLESFPDVVPGKNITVVTLPAGPDKPYASCTTIGERISFAWEARAGKRVARSLNACFKRPVDSTME